MARWGYRLVNHGRGSIRGEDFIRQGIPETPAAGRIYAN